MGLINCTDCNHPMSSDATICPNCNKPRLIGNTKQCAKCNVVYLARKRKCPNCGEIDFKNTIEKEIKLKSTKMNKSNITLISLLMFVIGAAMMYFTYPYIEGKQEVVKIEYAFDDAKVERINGLYVFLESRPVDSKIYTVIDVMEGDGLFDMIKSLGIGKEKFGKVLENIFVKSKENMNFREQLEKMTEQVKAKHENAQGLIFTNRIKKCEVIMFNNNLKK